VDSLSGINSSGDNVPDPMLSPGMRFGVQFRPRQSMFADRFTALENYLGRANTVLAQYPITEIRSFNLLKSAQPIPPANSGAWDFEVPNLEVLGYQNLAGIPVGYKYLVLNDSNQQGRWTIYTVGANQTLTLTQVQSYDTPLYWYYVNWWLPGYNSSVAPVAAVQNYGQLVTLSYETVPVGASVRVISNGAGKWEIYLRTGVKPATDWKRVGLEDGTIAFKESLWNYPSGNFGFDAQTFDSQYFDETPQIETRYIIQALNEEIYIDELLMERNSSLILMFNYVYSEFTNPSWLVKTSYVDVNHNIRALLPYQTYLSDNQDFVLDYFQEVKPYHVQPRQFNLVYDGEDDFLGDVTDFDLPAYWNSTLPAPQFVSPILTPYDEAITTHTSIASNTAPDAQIWIPPSLYSQWFNNYTLNVQGVSVINAGSGYLTPPVVTFGTEWQANTSYLLGQQVYYVNNLYTVTVPGVTSEIPPSFNSGSSTNGSTTLTYFGYPATGTCIINSSGNIIDITVTNPGSGYITDANVTISGGGLPATPIAWSAGLTVVTNSFVITTTNNIFTVATAGVLGNVAPWGQEDQINGTVALTFVGQVAEAGVVMGNPAGHSLARTFNLTLKYDRYEYTTAIVDWTTNSTYAEGTLVRFDNIVWNANSTITNPVFDPAQWTRVDAADLSGVNRTMGYYVSTDNTPGLSLPLLIDGIGYPRVQVTGFNFNQDTGFDVGNFDINPFDNYSIGPTGLPTYDLGLLDTIFGSSYLDIYLGTRPSDINVEGGLYVDINESHAPEELVPGIEFDTLDMRVYTTPGADWTGQGFGFPQAVEQIIYNSSSPTISFAGLIPYPFALEVTDATQGYNLTEGTDYTVDWPNQTVTIINASTLVTNGDQLGFYVYELGGSNQLFKNTYIGSEFGNVLTVPVEFDLLLPDNNGFAIVINGNYLDNTNYTYATGTVFGTTVITFNDTYYATDFISLAALGPTTVNNVTTDYSWSLPVTQSFTVPTTGQLIYNLDPAINLDYTNPVTAIVTIGGVVLTGSAGVIYEVDGATSSFDLPQRMGVDPTTIIDSEISVYINSILQDPGVYTLTAGVVYLDATPAIGSEVYIAVNVTAQYIIDPVEKTLTIVSGMGIIPLQGNTISVTTFNDTRQQRLSTQIFVGPVSEGITLYEAYDSTYFDNPPGVASSTPGQFDAAIGASISVNNLVLYESYTDISRPWVSLNGKTLTAYLDYTIEGNVLTLNYGTLGPTDKVVVTNVSNTVVPEAMAFRIFQDMRGVQATYRMTPSTTTIITQDVSQTADIIYVANASALSIPNFSANIWGVVTINGERIMYREIDLEANTISSLLRGTAGTAAAPHTAGAYVYDIGRGNLLPLPYQDYIVDVTILGDGTTTIFAASTISLAFTDAPTWVQASTYDAGTVVIDDGFYYRATIAVPANTAISNTTYWQSLSREVEVYVAGALQTSGYTVTSETPVIITFDTAPADGSEVIILVRRGVTWYAQGSDPLSASNGEPLQITNTIPARFLQGVN
jgi:hypothetical protein